MANSCTTYESIQSIILSSDDVNRVKQLLSEGSITRNDLRSLFVDYAARYGRTAIGEFFLSQGVSVDCRARDSETALFRACLHRQYSFVEMLLLHGANIDATSILGNTALILVCAHSGWNYAFVKMLLEHGANIDATNKEGRTALISLCANSGWYGSVVLVDMLLLRGANCRICDNNGDTALHVSCRNTYSECHGYSVAALVERGVDYLLPNKAGDTPLFLACEKGASVNYLCSMLIQNPGFLVKRYIPEDKTKEATKMAP